MYYQNYEDYMRSVLGYPAEPENTYESFNYSSIVPYERQSVSFNQINNTNSEMMDLYPDIYKIVNPMVCKICEANTKPITRQLVDQMTDEIYLNLESQPEFDTIVNIKVNTQKANVEKNTRPVNLSSSSNDNSSATKSKINSSKEEIKENRQDSIESRQARPNNMLRDLIRILILNRLLNGNFPNRPPRPRPPMPPHRPTMRPPYFRQEDNERYYDEYFRF